MVNGITANSKKHRKIISPNITNITGNSDSFCLFTWIYICLLTWIYDPNLFRLELILFQSRLEMHSKREIIDRKPEIKIYILLCRHYFVKGI